MKKNTEYELHSNAKQIIALVMKFLQLFMCETLAKRVSSIVLIAVGIPNQQVTELTGLCDKSVRTLRKSIETGETDALFVVKGGGRKSKVADYRRSSGSGFLCLLLESF